MQVSIWASLGQLLQLLWAVTRQWTPNGKAILHSKCWQPSTACSGTTISTGAYSVEPNGRAEKFCATRFHTHLPSTISRCLRILVWDSGGCLLLARLRIRLPRMELRPPNHHWLITCKSGPFSVWWPRESADQFGRSLESRTSSTTISSSIEMSFPFHPSRTTIMTIIIITRESIHNWQNIRLRWLLLILSRSI